MCLWYHCIVIKIKKKNTVFNLFFVMILCSSLSFQHKIIKCMAQKVLSYKGTYEWDVSYQRSIHVYYIIYYCWIVHILAIFALYRQIYQFNGALICVYPDFWNSSHNKKNCNMILHGTIWDISINRQHCKMICWVCGICLHNTHYHNWHDTEITISPLQFHDTVDMTTNILTIVKVYL